MLEQATVFRYAGTLIRQVIHTMISFPCMQRISAGFDPDPLVHTWSVLQSWRFKLQYGHKAWSSCTCCRHSLDYYRRHFPFLVEDLQVSTEYVIAGVHFGAYTHS